MLQSLFVEFRIYLFIFDSSIVGVRSFYCRLWILKVSYETLEVLYKNFDSSTVGLFCLAMLRKETCKVLRQQ